MEQWWNNTDWKNRITGGKTYPHVTCPVWAPICDGMGLNRLNRCRPKCVPSECNAYDENYEITGVLHTAYVVVY